MSKERLYLFDTTLRDGAQTRDVDFSLEDKKTILKLLDDLGIDYIEGGYPGANPLDTEFFSIKRTQKARFTAFGMVRRPGRSAENDPGLRDLLAAQCDTIVFVAKTWDYHVHVALETTLEDHLKSIEETLHLTRAHGRETILDCEHFFDGYKANPDYALSCAVKAYESGARWVVLCDTNGGTLPHEIAHIVRAVVKVIPPDHLGIHAHDDTGQGVANSLAAVRAGVRHIQGTLNGLGERCGNANLVSLLPTLLLKKEYADHYSLGVTRENLKNLTSISHTLDALLSRSSNSHAPYVGSAAFATKAGIHASALLKDPRTYEHIHPEAVGNRRHVLISDQGGKSNILAALERLGLTLEKNDPRVSRLLKEIKRKEALGYAYEGAEASFEIFAHRLLGDLPDYFSVERFSVNVDYRPPLKEEENLLAQAIVKVSVHGESFISTAEGNGPVHALDLALRKDLGIYQDYIKEIQLVDYRVRVFQGGTDAITRVLISFCDHKGESWSTVGASSNLIYASFEALTDSMTYKLFKSGAPKAI